MLPAPSPRPRRLAEVMPDSLVALTGGGGRLPAVRSVIVVLVDGLGAAALRRRSGHARTLAARLSKRDVIDAGFPTTTASSLASLTTGRTPIEHGFVGYAVHDAANDRILRLLDGWDARADPVRWQPQETVFEQATAAGLDAVAIGPPKYADSGFSRAVLRGARYLGATRLEERFELAVRAAAERPSLVYLYVPELDKLAHRHGVESAEWTRTLETLDGAVRDRLLPLGSGVGVALTADHGVIDVPQHGHVLLEPTLLAGVRHLAGEPRAPQLVLERPEEADAVAERFAAALGELAWVATKAEAVDSGLFGSPADAAPAALERLGEVVVIARRKVAFYADPKATARNMVGQHGALSDEERDVPLLRFGAWA